MLKILFLNCTLLAAFAGSAAAQTASNEIKTRVDAVITAAYESASAQFPCKLGAGGSPKMLRWQGIDKCLNYANDRVDWEEISQQLQNIRKDFRLQLNEIMDLAESSFSTHALPYDKVFIVKQNKALLPLSSSLLKFLPEESLQGLPVFDKSGKEVGTFSGLYAFEKSGEITGNRSRLALFQYTDSKGTVHPSPERLLLDSFGVPWKDAASQPGFRLPSNKIVLK